MGNINRYPLGLLSLLDSQTQGVAPDEMLRTVQATEDITVFHLNNKGIESETVSEVLTTAGIGSSRITVPQDELWWVYAVSVQSFCLDGTNVPFPGIRIRPSRSATGMPYATTIYTNATNGAVGSSSAVTFHPPLPLILGGGTNFDHELLKISGAVVNGFTQVLTVHFVRLRQ